MSGQLHTAAPLVSGKNSPTPSVPSEKGVGWAVGLRADIVVMEKAGIFFPCCIGYNVMEFA